MGKSQAGYASAVLAFRQIRALRSTGSPSLPIRKLMIQQWKDGKFDSLIIWTEQKESQLIQLLEKGLTHLEIAEIMGMTKDAVGSHIREMKKRG